MITKEDILKYRAKPYRFTYHKIGLIFGVSRQRIHQILAPKQPQPKYRMKRTHCKRGHPFSGTNVRMYNTTHGVMRQCVKCVRIHSKNRTRK